MNTISEQYIVIIPGFICDMVELANDLKAVHPTLDGNMLIMPDETIRIPLYDSKNNPYDFSLNQLRATADNLDCGVEVISCEVETVR